jgi:hypothetical protein
MRRAYAVLLLAACADPGPDVETDLRARRAALGLPRDPLTFQAAMAAMQKGAYEPLLGREAALRIENLLARADPATAEGRAADPKAFDALVEAARRGADRLARAAAGGREATAEAYDLLTTCVNCHRTFRRPP